MNDDRIITKLEKVIVGVGEVKETVFTQVYENEKGYIYQASSSEGTPYFDVFKKKLVPKCIDFEKRIYSETEFKESYPKSGDFGVWAWTVERLEQGINKLNQL